MVAAVISPVRREDILRGPRGLYCRGPLTTAHQSMARLVIEEERRRPASWVERIAAAPSPFAVEGLVGDFALFGSRYASAKVRLQVYETARVRVCELRGLLP